MSHRQEVLMSDYLTFCLFSADRNSGKSKVIPEEVDKRKTLFWELLYLDARLVSFAHFVPPLCRKVDS